MIIRWVKPAAALWSAGATVLTNEFTGNTNIFPTNAKTVSYSIISGHGVSPVSEYVVYSSSQTVTVKYNYLDFKIADPGSGETTGTADHDNKNKNVDDCSAYDNSGNNSYDSPAGWSGGRVNVRFRIAGAGGSLINGKWGDIEWYNNGTSKDDICKDQTFTVSLTYDEVSGMYRGYFLTEIGWQHRDHDGHGANRVNPTGSAPADYNVTKSQAEYWATNAQSDIGYWGVRLKHSLSLVKSNGTADDHSYITYGKPSSDGGNPRTTVTIQQHGSDKAYLPFGLTCEESQQQKGIVLYDVDNNIADVNVWYQVQSYRGPGPNDWDLVSISDSTPIPTKTNGASYGDGYTYTPPKGVSSDFVTIKVKLSPNTRYRLVMGGFDSGSGDSYNFYQVQMPSDAIYGEQVSCPSYDLTPKVTSTNGTVAVGDKVTFRNSISSAKTSTGAATGVQWASYRFISHNGLEPSVQEYQDNIDNICAVAALVGTSCKQIGSGTGESVSVSQATTLDDTFVDTAGLGLHYGDKVCSFLAISPYHRPLSDNPKNWRVSATTCVTITKTPRLQVWGNDVRVGSTFSSASDNQSSLIQANTGSWGEYGVLAPNSIKGLGSGGSSSGSALTFANTGTQLGSFAAATDLGTIPAVRAYLEKAAGVTGTQIDLHSDTVAPSYTIGATTLDTASPDDSPVYIYPNADVTISGDIVNNSTGGTLRQMVIIAKNIYIDPGVKQVDAWLIASGTVNTCNSSDYQKVGACGANSANSTLRINGPIMAKQLLLRRTGGDDGDANSAAEIVNLRGDAYIWMRKLSGLTGTVRTVYTRELPPRY
jgi:hypothetical protein